MTAAYSSYKVLGCYLCIYFCLIFTAAHFSSDSRQGTSLKQAIIHYNQLNILNSGGHAVHCYFDISHLANTSMVFQSYHHIYSTDKTQGSVADTFTLNV